MIQTIQILILLIISQMVIAQAPCPNQCLQCDPSGSICFACDNGLGINVFGQCNENSIDHCVIYGPSGECFNCQPTFKLQKNSCARDYSGCVLENSNDGSCFDCGFGTILKGSTCTGVINCKQFDGVCKTCQDGYILNGNVCRDISQGCKKVRNQDGICEQCHEDYNYIGYKCIHEDTFVPRCYIYDEKKACLFCENGFKLYDKKCLLTKQIEEQEKKKAQQVNQQPQHCQVPDVLNPPKCIVCEYGYYPQNGFCKKVSALCGEHNVQTGDCFDCKYGLKVIGGKCIDENCQFSNADETCGTCKQSFQPNNNGVCEYNDASCIQSFNGRCQKCIDGFYVDFGGKCVVLPPNCKFANFQNGACLECHSGYKPNNGACDLLPQIPNCDVVDPGNPSKCIVCVYGYFPSGNACEKVSPLCGQHNVQTGDCIDCKNPKLSPQQGKCVDPNCEFPGVPSGCQRCRLGYYSSISGICEALPPNCASANAQGSCTGCHSGFNPVNGRCESSFTIPNCQDVDSLRRICNRCSNGYEWKFNQCSQIVVTPPPTVPSGNQGTIKSSDPNCLQSSNGVCVKCSQRYYLREKKCVPINPLCQTHNDRGQCTTCYRGYSLNNGKCQIGVSADPNCKTSSNGFCSECYKGFYFNQNDRVCKRLNALCKTSNLGNGHCTSCYPGYQLNPSSGSCDVFFKDPNCMKTNSNNLCEECSKRYYISSSTGKCSPVNPLCFDYDPRTGFCTDCYRGYGVKDGQCIPGGINQDENCKEDNNGYCVQCYKRFYPQNGKCKQVDQSCKDYRSTDGSCTACYPGYTISQGRCIQGNDRDPNCKDFSSSNYNYCIDCYQGFLALNGGCQKKNPLCQTVNETNGDCLTCWRGYVLVAGDCLVESQVKAKTPTGQVDPYCIKMVGQVCDECSQGFYYDNVKCQQADPLCKTFNNRTGFCTSCYPGYQPSDGKCIVGKPVNIPYCNSVNAAGFCVECMENYYVKGNQCQPVSILCGGNYNKATGTCTSCVSGYFLQDGECIFPALYDEFCIRYQSAYCNECQYGFYLESYQCQPVDRFCSKFDYDNKLCESCSNGKRPVGRDCV